MQTDNAFLKLCDIVARLRAPDGCPWDREQDPESLCADLVEETYECIEAITEKDPVHIKEELGDLFLLLTMISHMHEEEGKFTIADVLEGISEKLVRRHPHVFSDVKVKDSAEVLDNWAKIKIEQEGRKPKDSILDEVPHGIPPLDRTLKLQKKAAKYGFDWPDLDGVLKKTEEELGEVREAIKSDPAHLEEELGDLLFMAVNLCRFKKVDPSAALAGTNSKFVRRFKHVEKRMKEAGQVMNSENLLLMDKYWDEAKIHEKK